MAYGLLLMRVAIGGIFFAHGTQKLFGWWGGGGLKGTAAWLQGMGFHAPDVMSLLVALGESGGILFALGLLTPFAALGMASAMVVAIAAVHWPKASGAPTGATSSTWRCSRWPWASRQPGPAGSRSTGPSAGTTT
jgi:putative oxidoreductase